jgi:hypothetical protein
LRTRQLAPAAEEELHHSPDYSDGRDLAVPSPLASSSAVVPAQIACSTGDQGCDGLRTTKHRMHVVAAVVRVIGVGIYKRAHI